MAAGHALQQKFSLLRMSTHMQYETLKRNKEFSLVYSRGKSFATKKLVIVYLPRRYGGIRVGFTVSKKVGNSVKRNRLRRQFREAYRTMLPELQANAHIIFIARASVAQADFQEIRKDMRYLLSKVQLIDRKPGQGHHEENIDRPH